MTPNPEFKGRPLFDVKYPGNDIRYGDSYNDLERPLKVTTVVL